MSRVFDIPGGERLVIERLLLDVNGTLTNRGELIEGVRPRLDALRPALRVLLLTADTFGTAASIAGELGAEHRPVTSGEDKARLVEELGAARTAAVGNGRNDAAMLAAAGLGIAVLGPEGASVQAVSAADVVCASILDALDLLLDERALAATLRP